MRLRPDRQYERTVPGVRPERGVSEMKSSVFRFSTLIATSLVGSGGCMTRNGLAGFNQSQQLNSGIGENLSRGALERMFWEQLRVLAISGGHFRLGIGTRFRRMPRATTSG